MSGGSFENLIYDQGAYCVDLKQSTAPLLHTLDPIFANSCTACRPGDIGYIGKQGVSLTMGTPLIDVESDLKLLNYRNSRDPAKKYIPCCPYCKKCYEGYPCGGGVVAGCVDCQAKMYHLPECSIGTDYSRVTNPPCTLKGTGVNRFQPLCLDPQDPNRWLHPGEIGINYRLVVKDNNVPCVPEFMSQSDILPHPTDTPVINCKNKCDYTCDKYWFGSPLFHTYDKTPVPCPGTNKNKSSTAVSSYTY